MWPLCQPVEHGALPMHMTGWDMLQLTCPHTPCAGAPRACGSLRWMPMMIWVQLVGVV